MPLTVRLGPTAERALNALAKRRRQSRSDVVREALVHYDAATGGSDAAGPRPFDAWMDVIGIINVGARQAGRTSGEEMTTIVRDKARARRAR